MLSFDLAASRLRCRHYRKRLLDLSQSQAALHLGGAFSCLEMVDACYHGLMRHPLDTFILSKGHGCLAQYAVLEQMGILNKPAVDGLPGDLDLFCRPGGRLGGHPDRGVPGIEASTGSLGHGLPIAVGMALADRQRHVYVVMSDGEMQEGSTWEAMRLAPEFRLDNLTVMVDVNGLQSLGKDPGCVWLLDRARAFRWSVCEVPGHEPEMIVAAAQRCNRPLFLSCRTVKGKGVSFFENKPIWHYRSPTPEEYRRAVEEVMNA